MEKIRVLHILDELNTGGAEQIVCSYLENIDRSRYHWDFIVMDIPGKPEGRLEQKVRDLGCRIFKVTKKQTSILQNIKDVSAVIKNGKYDIVHSHLYEISAVYLLLARIHGVKVRIAHSHSWNQSRGWKVDALRALLKPLAKLTANGYAACGKDAAKCLWGEKLLKQGKVTIIANAIDAEKFGFDVKEREAVRSALGLADETVIGTVGRLAREKNPIYYIEVFRAFQKMEPNSKLLVVGEGELLDPMKARIREYGLEENVLLLGRRNDVHRLLNAMDVFILPSVSEGLPIVLVEAQCNGLPCLMSDAITDEAVFSPNVKQLPLNDHYQEWAECLKSLALARESDRNTAMSRVADANYEIKSEANKLDAYYMAMLKVK